VGRDPDRDALRDGRRDVLALLVELRERVLRRLPEHLEVDDRPQAELGARVRAGAGEGEIADRRHPRA
jgi:hypothetical protein